MLSSSVPRALCSVLMTFNHTILTHTYIIHTTSPARCILIFLFPFVSSPHLIPVLHPSHIHKSSYSSTQPPFHPPLALFPPHVRMHAHTPHMQPQPKTLQYQKRKTTANEKLPKSLHLVTGVKKRPSNQPPTHKPTHRVPYSHHHLQVLESQK